MASNNTDTGFSHFVTTPSNQFQYANDTFPTPTREQIRVRELLFSESTQRPDPNARPPRPKTINKLTAHFETPSFATPKIKPQTPTLLGLAAEIRLMIYKYVSQDPLYVTRSTLEGPNPPASFVVHPSKRQWRVDAPNNPEQYFATWRASADIGSTEAHSAMVLLKINRQMRREAQPVILRYPVVIATHIDALNEWLAHLDPIFGTIRHLDLHTNVDCALTDRGVGQWMELFHKVSKDGKLRTLTMDILMLSTCPCDYNCFSNDHIKWAWLQNLEVNKHMVSVDVSVRAFHFRQGLHNWLTFPNYSGVQERNEFYFQINKGHGTRGQPPHPLTHARMVAMLPWIPLPECSDQLERYIREKCLSQKIREAGIDPPSNMAHNVYHSILRDASNELKVAEAISSRR